MQELITLLVVVWIFSLFAGKRAGWLIRVISGTIAGAAIFFAQIIASIMVNIVTIMIILGILSVIVIAFYVLRWVIFGSNRRRW